MSRELKAGIITLLSLAALFWGLNFLKGIDIFGKERAFYAVYSRVEGLTPSRPVNINGFQVGRVDDIRFHPDGSGRLLVKMVMTNDVALPRDSEALIYSTDLLGEKAIKLKLGTAPQKAQPGDTLVSDIQLTLTEEVNKQVAPIKNKAETLLGSIDTTIVLLQGFLNPQTKKNFTETFESISRTFASLEHSVKTFDTTLTSSRKGLVHIVGNLEKTTTTLANNRDKLDNSLDNINAVSDSLSQVRFKQTFRKLESALSRADSALAKVNQGKGSAGKLVNDPALYQNLEEATKQLNLLLLDLKYNPQRYLNFSIFGNTGKYDEEDIRAMEAEKEKKRP
jgi:phospholipid/cholesterol/gamma-HCH transport system substrate-binding protein